MASFSQGFSLGFDIVPNVTLGGVGHFKLALAEQARRLPVKRRSPGFVDRRSPVTFAPVIVAATTQPVAATPDVAARFGLLNRGR